MEEFREEVVSNLFLGLFTQFFGVIGVIGVFWFSCNIHALILGKSLDLFSALPHLLPLVSTPSTSSSMAAQPAKEAIM